MELEPDNPWPSSTTPTPFIVRAVVPGTDNGDNHGTFYIAFASTEQEAMALVQARIGDGWKVEGIVGTTSQDEIERRGLRPGSVVPYYL